LKIRRRMKVYLARYARQNVLQWDEVQVPDLIRWFLACSKLMEDEAKSGDSDDLFD
jgi:hypothetical protein